MKRCGKWEKRGRCLLDHAQRVLAVHLPHQPAQVHAAQIGAAVQRRQQVHADEHKALQDARVEQVLERRAPLGHFELLDAAVQHQVTAGGRPLLAACLGRLRSRTGAPIA